jgi:hypothetical protein
MSDAWKTMDSAPRDRKRVLLWARECGLNEPAKVWIGFYREPGIGKEYRNREEITGWYSVEEYQVEYPDDIETRNYALVPSRWMPEPSPPEDKVVPIGNVWVDPPDMVPATAEDYDILASTGQ